MTIGDLEVQLQRILTHAQYIQETSDGIENGKYESVAGRGVGALTGTDRTTWAKAREELCAHDLSNGRNLRDIESALFVMCLDDASPSSPAELIELTAGGNCKNRWYDKSLQYMVFRNGIVGANMEHGNADATIFMSMFRWLGQRYLERAGGIETLIESRTEQYLPPPEPARWCLTESLLGEIETAAEEFKKRDADFSPITERFKGFGRTWLKQQRLAPDSFVQMALQLTYFTIFGECCSTYESAHTRFFYHGRTETIRPCSTESMDWCRSMRSSAPVGEKMEKLRTAIDRHMEIGMNALNGQGCDRHLLGLQIASVLSGSELPELFKDVSYGKSGGGGTFKLSTSNVSGYQWLWGGFAPMVESGIGVCYDIDYEFLGFMVTTYRSNQPVKSKEFARVLFNCLREMKDLVLATNSSKL